MKISSAAAAVKVPAVFISSIYKLKYKAMKEFMNIWIEPFKTKELDRHEKFVLGVVAPAAFVAVVILSHLLP
jgi:hypothetical protein